ncbi:MAG: hypothetical protein FJW14_15280 [Acidimicrobiia bacterium]|nr:hypothetical protein [Acidimicrobiia bacterium]
MKYDPKMRATRLCGFLAATVLVMGCGGLSSLGRLIQPPTFGEADSMPAELRLRAPPAANPLGGAGVTVWLEVTNPSPFGFTLSTLQTTLHLEGSACCAPSAGCTRTCTWSAPTSCPRS